LETTDPEKHEQILHDMLNQFGRSVILNSEPLRGRIAMLNDGGFAPWKGIVYLKLCRFVVETNCRTSDSHQEAMMVLKLKNGACEIVKTCLQYERLVLVGIAVWKAQCQGDEVFAFKQLNVFETHLSFVESMISGWKTNKAKHHKSNAIGIIQKLVRPFLQ
jgi:hypothetical protein